MTQTNLRVQKFGHDFSILNREKSLKNEIKPHPSTTRQKRHAYCVQTIATGATRLLSVIDEVIRSVYMHDASNRGIIHFGVEDGRDNDVKTERTLTSCDVRGGSFIRGQTAVIKGAVQSGPNGMRMQHIRLIHRSYWHLESFQINYSRV